MTYSEGGTQVMFRNSCSGFFDLALENYSVFSGKSNLKI